MANKNIKGITIEIGGSTTGLDKALKQVNDTSYKLKNELKDVEKGLKFDPTNVELLSQKNTLLAQAVANAKEKVESLRMAQGQVEQQFKSGEIGEESYRAFQRELIASENELKKLESQLKLSNSDLMEFGKNGAAVAASQQKQAEAAEKNKKKQEELSSKIEDGKNALGKWSSAAEKVKSVGISAFEGVKSAVSSATNAVSNAVSAIAKSTAVGISAITAAVSAGAAASVKAYEEVWSGTENVIKATGATGEAADALNESYKNVASTINADFSTIGSALGEVNTRFGYTGEQLEACTEDFLKFAEITGTDATSAVQLVSRAMSDAGIESDEYMQVLDSLAVAAQASGISVDTLTTNLAKYGAPMRALGLTTNESIAIFAGWEKAGVNTEIAFSGMKTAIGKWGKEGKDASKEFKAVLDEIAAMPDIADATAKAIEVFGQKAGPDLADAIQGGRFEYSDFLEIIENSEGTVKNTFDETVTSTDKIKTAFNGLKVRASEVGEVISDVMGNYVSDGIGLVSQAIDNLNIDSDELKKKIESHVAPAIEKIKEKAKEIIDFISSHKQDIISVIEGIKEKIENNVIPVIENIKEKAKEIIDFIVSHKDEIFTAIDEIKSVISDVVEVVKEIIAWIIDNKETVLAALVAIGTALLAFNVVTMIQGVIAAFKEWWAVTEGLTLAQKLLNTQIFANPVGLIVAAIAGLVAAFVVLWNTCEPFKQFWLDLWEEIKKTVATFCDYWVAGWEEIKQTVGTFYDYWVAGVEIIKQGFNDFTNSDFMQRIIYHFQQIIDFIKNVFTGDFNSAWENIKNIFKNIWEGFVDIAKNPLNSVLSFINSLISGINLMISSLNNINITIPEWVPEVGGESIGFNLPEIPTIPLLAKGGILSSGTAIVGEAGAELLTVANGRAVVQPLTNNNQSVANNINYNATDNRPVFNGKIDIPVYLYPNSNEFSRAVVTANQLNAAMTGGR